MTIGIGWIGCRGGGSEHLYFASDSRVRGGHRLDACPKILTLPRSDCAMCFAGDTAATYPLMLQMSYAIGAHQPSRERALDIGRVKNHIVRIATDLIRSYEDVVEDWTSTDVQFLFGGYSWLKQDFRLWTIYFKESDRSFAAREAVSFHDNLRKAAFIGDWAKPVRSRVHAAVAGLTGPAHIEPLIALADCLESASESDTIGGPPQVVRIARHMNTRPLCVPWRGADTLFGRPLFDYENTDYWVLDPRSGEIRRPRKFGVRDAGSVDGA